MFGVALQRRRKICEKCEQIKCRRDEEKVTATTRHDDEISHCRIFILACISDEASPSQLTWRENENWEHNHRQHRRDDEQCNANTAPITLLRWCDDDILQQKKDGKMKMWYQKCETNLVKFYHKFTNQQKFPHSFLVINFASSLISPFTSTRPFAIARFIIRIRGNFAFFSLPRAQIFIFWLWLSQKKKGADDEKRKTVDVRAAGIGWW